jgi:hypothetical protein
MLCRHFDWSKYGSLVFLCGRDVFVLSVLSFSMTSEISGRVTYIDPLKSFYSCQYTRRHNKSIYAKPRSDLPNID